MGKFADRLAWLMGWDILSVEPHKCHSTREWAARLSLPRAAELEVQRIAQEQERQARQLQPQLSPNESDRLQLPASEPAITDPTADTEDQMKAIGSAQPLPLSLVDLLEAMLEQQSGELLLSQVEAIVSKPRFRQVFPHLGQVDRAQLIAALRQLEAQKQGKLSFPANDSPLFLQHKAPAPCHDSCIAAQLKHSPNRAVADLPAQVKEFLEYCDRRANRYADAEGWFHFTKLRTNWAADRGFNAESFRAFLNQINQSGLGEWMQNDPMKWRPIHINCG
ncbi:hypothetical protein [Leptolyngbya sp. FACHB-711]|uniref:hypothetical protein n=1 Tax=Leptolyngbya sp. FACHB-711 TaxID=2692813 RepID=UPI0016823C0A|nr:hypothetical protein [Leptolyngbya sp. FACHB-711]MBD2023814.1 hypothetical protein [Leptolyngbya sp. FACHB-711]